MKRILAFTLALLACVLLLASCKEQEDSGRFLVVEGSELTTGEFSVIVDSRSGVEYIVRGNEVEPLIDSYGQPMIYSAFDAREDSNGRMD